MDNISFKGLSHLITFHKLFGISYFGASVDSEDRKSRKLSSFLSIIWNLIFFGLLLKFFIGLLKEKNSKENNFNSSKKLIIFFLTNIGVSGYYVQSVFINILLMVRGKRIIDLLKTQSFKFIDQKKERRIGSRILFIQFIFFFTIELVYSITDLVFRNTFNIILHLFFLSVMINISSIIALIAYQNKIICLQIDEFLVKFSPKDLPEIYRFMCKVNSFVKKFDSLVSSVNFMLIINSSVICVSYICLLMIRFEKKMDSFAYYSLCLIENILLLSILCYSCSIIPKRIAILCEKIEELMSQYITNYSTVSDLNNHLIISKIDSIKQ